ncbi:MAG: hypothetical protein M5U09_03620 [Gammaproteobacteria bacterium]|nr:hypothetical protein [Gammaproteobacteria bacterium]
MLRRIPSHRAAVYACVGSTVFASELRPPRAVPDLPLEIDREALHSICTRGFIPHPWTIFTVTSASCRRGIGSTLTARG